MPGPAGAPQVLRTPQEQVFGNQDLLPIILSILDYHRERRPSWFLNVAVISSVFRDAALDALWRRLPSFVPVLKRLPGLRVELDGAFVRHGYLINGVLTCADYA